MKRGRRGGATKGRVTALAGIAVVAAVLLFGASLWDRLTSDDEVEPVTILRQGEAAGAGKTQFWTLDVAAGETLIVEARAVELVRQDDGSRIDNVLDDRILLVAEGGHPYELTIEDGRWVVVAEGDGEQGFCYAEQRRDDWGVQYKPSAWPDDPC